MSHANPQSASLEISLARLGEPGANFYNSYHCLTQIAALYAQAAEAVDEAGDKALLGELADAVLGDLGEVFTLWETILKGDVPTAEIVDDTNFGAGVARVCLRLAAILRHVNAWTPSHRWTRLLQLMEARWQRIVQRLRETTPTLRVRLERVHQGSLSRSSRLTGLAESQDKRRNRINGHFAVDDHSASGGMGF